MKITYNEIEDGESTTCIRGTVMNGAGYEIEVLSSYIEKQISKDYDSRDVVVFDHNGESSKFVDGRFSAIVMK